MKPIGRERDREIAEAKGWSVTPTNEVFDILYKEGEKGVLACPHWSTSITDAWELWEELPNPKGFDQVDGGCVITFKNNQNSIWIWREIWGESFPDAVTQAWLECFGKKGVK